VHMGFQRDLRTETHYGDTRAAHSDELYPN